MSGTDDGPVRQRRGVVLGELPDGAAQVVTLRGAAIEHKADLMREMGEALRFPRWVGRNWDALADALMDLSWFPEGGLLIVWEAAEVLGHQDATAFSTAVGILEEAVARWEGTDRPLMVAILGAGVG